MPISTKAILKDEFLKEKNLIKLKGYDESPFFPCIELKHNTGVITTSFSRTGKYFAVGEDDGRITIYDLLGNIIKSFLLPPKAENAPKYILSIEFNAFDEYILVGRQSQSPMLLDFDGNLIVEYKRPYDNNLANNVGKIVFNEKWEQQETCIARFSTSGRYVIGSSMTSDRHGDLENLRHHITNPKPSKFLQVWDLEGDLLSINDLSVIDEDPNAKFETKVILSGGKRFIPCLSIDSRPIVAKEGNYALSTYEDRVYLQDLTIGTVFKNMKDLELEQLYFLYKCIPSDLVFDIEKEIKEMEKRLENATPCSFS